MPKVGDTVLYVSSKGQDLPALVLTTPETFKEGSSLTVLEDGQLNLAVFRISGITNLFNVPSLESVDEDPEHQDDFGLTVRCWKPRD